MAVRRMILRAWYSGSTWASVGTAGGELPPCRSTTATLGGANPSSPTPTAITRSAEDYLTVRVASHQGKLVADWLGLSGGTGHLLILLGQAHDPQWFPTATSPDQDWQRVTLSRRLSPAGRTC